MHNINVNLQPLWFSVKTQKYYKKQLKAQWTSMSGNMTTINTVCIYIKYIIQTIYDETLQRWRILESLPEVGALTSSRTVVSLYLEVDVQQ